MGDWDEGEGQQGQSFTAPILGALFSSLVIVTVIAVLNTSLGRGLEDDLDAPARAMVAFPIVVLASVVFCACVVALVAPAQRRESMRVAEIAGWLVPSWLVMAGMVLGAVSYALDHA
jgi:glycerol uptake facilitator-like aquaporin